MIWEFFVSTNWLNEITCDYSISKKMNMCLYDVVIQILCMNWYLFMFNVDVQVEDA